MGMTNKKVVGLCFVEIVLLHGAVQIIHICAQYPCWSTQNVPTGAIGQRIRRISGFFYELLLLQIERILKQQKRI